jgi:predicted regulator of amino acid metabolism with ACT domain
MNTVDFAKTIREKFPNGIASDGTSYADMSDQDLVGKIVQKYPTYKSQIDDLLSGGTNILDSAAGAVKEFGSDVITAVKDRATNVKNDMLPQTPEDAKKVAEGGTNRALLRFGGQVGGLVGDLELATLKLVAPKFVEDLAAKGMDKISKTELAQTVATKIDEFKTAHPEASQDIEDVVNIAALIPYIKGAQLTAEGVQKGGKAVTKIADAAIDANKAARLASATEEIDSVVGKIVQGKTRDLTKAKAALSSINTEGIKTYEELGTRLQDGIDALKGKVDTILEDAGSTTGPLKADQLTTITKVGEKTVQQNFVSDALDQLDELYGKIKDAPSQAKIANLKTKLNSEGLTLKELNDVAREYGTEFGNKAFSPKSGEALTSINAQAYENTRKGVKNAVRELMPDNTVKMLDERMGEMINTNKLVKNMEEKVNALYQKAKKRGVLEKVARGAADVVNAATFNTLSGFVSRLLPSNVGLKVMNSIDLENALGKSLKKLDDLMKVTNDASLTDGIVKFVKENTR